MISGLIVNPRSGKGRGTGVALAARLQGTANVHVRVLDRFDDLGPSLDEMADAGVSTVFISSGDGTIQQVQTELAERRPFERLPELALLAHGTTNMTAADLGLGVKNLDEVKRIIVDADYRHRRTERRGRATVRVANPADGKVRHGMFVGTGAVWRATVFCQKAVHRAGLRGDWATMATLAAAVFKAMVSDRRSQDPERISQAYDMRIWCGDEIVVEDGQLFFLATTLDRLILGSRPFWGDRHGALRASVFPSPPPNVLRWLWRSMYGAENRIMPPGCISFSGDLITIDTRVPFVIDGEFFDPPAGEPLRLEKGAEFTYVCTR